VQLAQDQPNLSLLVTALTKFPDLVTTLSGTGKFTVFAPTNDAFTALLGAIGQTSINDVPEPVLKSLLQYHVVTSGAVLSTQLTAGNVATANMETIAVTTKGGISLNGSEKVLTADVNASNGVVHIIDQVLVPALLTAASTASSNLTVFAPTDAAFRELYTALGVAGINDINLNTLTAVLQHHIISSPTTATGRVFSRDLITGSVPTLNGNLSISATAGTVTSGNGTMATISSNSALVDVFGTNGVIHTINKVLLPSGK
jgi:transforming growth factor-beta-induced protein